MDMDRKELIRQLEDLTEHEAAELFCQAKQQKEEREKKKARSKEEAAEAFRSIKPR